MGRSGWIWSNCGAQCAGHQGCCGSTVEGPENVRSSVELEFDRVIMEIVGPDRKTRASCVVESTQYGVGLCSGITVKKWER